MEFIWECLHKRLGNSQTGISKECMELISSSCVTVRGAVALSLHMGAAVPLLFFTLIMWQFSSLL